MRWLVPHIHVLLRAGQKTRMAGTSPAMTRGAFRRGRLPQRPACRKCKKRGWRIL